MSMKITVKIMLSLILCSFVSISAIAAPPWPIPEGVKTVNVNGYDMAYQETGEGIPLVLIHGSLTDFRTWKNQIPEFSKSYRTIAVSLRHHYPEKWKGAGDDFTVAQHASDVGALIKKLNLGKVHLLGHSRGGPIALTVAKRYPEVIRTLILEDANIDTIVPDSPEKQKRSADWLARAKVTRATLEAGNPEKAAQEWLDSYAGPGTWEKMPPPVKGIILDNVWSATDSGERGEITCPDILTLNLPILLLTGEKSPKQYGEIYSLVRKCRSDIPAPVLVPNGTHSMHASNPSFFNQAVLEFLKQH